MKPRRLALGNRNLIGARVTEARKAQGMRQVELLAKLQLAGIDMSVPALSLLEGQKRPVSDIELNGPGGHSKCVCELTPGPRRRMK